MPRALLVACLLASLSSASAAAKTLPNPYDGPCEGLSVSRRDGPLAFSPGEAMGFDFKAGPLFLGRMDIKVGQPRVVEGRTALPLLGHARTSMFASSVKKFEGRYLSLMDAEALIPLGMRTQTVYDDDPRRERAQFSDDRARVDIQYFKRGKDGKRSYQRDRAIFDILSLLYHARALELRVGDRICQEVVADRRLWRMEAKVRGKKRVGSRYGRRRALVIDITFDRVPHRDFRNNNKRPHFELELLLSDDAARLPLRFEVRNKIISARAELVRFEA